jgi:integrin alpha FG-GAP repeat containing protein 1
MVKTDTTSYEYQRVVAYAPQLSQSAYMALQMPYVIFGLGATPNFVEHLTVGILAKTPDELIKGYRKDWPQIIPNSQLVISPNPRYITYK